MESKKNKLIQVRQVRKMLPWHKPRSQEHATNEEQQRRQRFWKGKAMKTPCEYYEWRKKSPKKEREREKVEQIAQYNNIKIMWRSSMKNVRERHLFYRDEKGVACVTPISMNATIHNKCVQSVKILLRRIY